MARESLDNKKKRAGQIMDVLRRLYPDAQCALHHKNPFELLIATILSAQCTDVRVNMVTPVLFAKYPTPQNLAGAPQADVEKIVQSTGFFRSKARSIRETSADLVAKYGGKVPQTMEELTNLRGVGRKTANVVLGNAFDQNVGIVVDTHVARLSKLLGLTTHTDAVKIEQDLIQLVPQKEWTMLAHYLIFHGRQICIARRPKCAECALLPLCPAGPKLLQATEKAARR